MWWDGNKFYRIIWVALPDFGAILGVISEELGDIAITWYARFCVGIIAMERE